MKILLVSTDYLPNVSGIATLSCEQAKGLAQLGHDVVVVTTFPDSLTDRASLTDQPHEKVPALRISTNLPPILRLGSLFRQLDKTVRTYQPDFIWCTNYRGFGLPVMLTARRHNVPYGIYFHGTELITENKSNLRRRLLKSVALRSRLVATNSKNSAQLISDFYGLESHVCTPGVNQPAEYTDNDNGIAHSRRLEWLSRKKTPVPVEEITIFTAACRVSRQKGLHIVLQAMSGMERDELERTLFVIIGSGPDEADLLALAKSIGVDHRVIFHGPASRAEIPGLLRAADVYVQPSQPEGDFLESFGISFLEAQAAGLPCIATNWGGIPEAVMAGTTALLVEPGSVQSVRDAMQRVMTDKSWRVNASEAGVAFANQNSWERHSRQIESLIRSAGARLD